MLANSLSRTPIMAILRGLQPEHAASTGQVLYQQGIRVIEVPLNRPHAIAAIEILANTLPDDCLIGAGTVLTLSDVAQVKSVGGKLIVSPHCDTAIIEQTVNDGLISLPGVATASEAFTAHRAGANALKIFPASSYGPAHIKALKTVLPESCQLIAVGGIKLSDLATWLAHGALAVGIGSELFAAGDTANDVANKLKVLGITNESD